MGCFVYVGDISQEVSGGNDAVFLDFRAAKLDNKVNKTTVITHFTARKLFVHCIVNMYVTVAFCQGRSSSQDVHVITHATLN